MANHRFDYPTVIGATSSLEFTEGARLSGDTPSLKSNQDTALTLGGTRTAKSYSAAKDIWPLTVIFYCDHATLIDFISVKAWIESVANWAVNPFVWIDENSVARTVRIINDEFTFPKFGHNTQSCTFQLEEQ